MALGKTFPTPAPSPPLWLTDCRQRARNVNLVGFGEATNVGRYVRRKNAKIAEYEPDVPVCESGALEEAASCNALPLAEATSTCPLPPECDSAGVRFYCELVTYSSSGRSWSRSMKKLVAGAAPACCKGYYRPPAYEKPEIGSRLTSYVRPERLSGLS